jgi:NADH:ubiquinone oxidoreductase subunit E
MPNTKTKVPFAGTKEQEARLMEVIGKLKGQKGATMPILQQAQEIYGYLPEEVQILIAEELGLSLSEIYGVVSFYTQFTLNPKGEHTVSICLGTACYVKGAGDVLARAEKVLGVKAGEMTGDGKFSLDATRCLGCCGLAPVMVIDEDVYGRLVRTT